MNVVMMIYSDEARQTLVDFHKFQKLPEGEPVNEGVLSEGVLDADSNKPLFYRIARLAQADMPRRGTDWSKPGVI